MPRNDEDDWEDIPASASTEGEWVDEEDPEALATRLAEEDYERRRPTKLQSAGAGALQGLTRNWGDEITGRIRSALQGGSYEDAKRAMQQDIYRAKTENPKSYGMSEFAAMLSAAPATMNPIAAGGIAAGEGAARSLGEADRINRQSVKEAAGTGAVDAATAGLATKFGPAVFGYAGKLAKPASDYFKGVAGRQAVKALGPTQGMLKTLRDKNLTEDVGNYALDTGIVNSYRTNAGMNEKAESVLKKLAEERRPIYEAAKDKMMTKDELIAAINQRRDELMLDPGSVPIAEKLGKYGEKVEKAAEAGRTAYNPSDVSKYRQSVSKGINFNTKPNSQMGADEFRQILREKEMGLIEQVNPALRRKNEDLFRRIHLSKQLEPIAERGEARDAANNMIGLRTSGLGGIVGAATGAATGDPAMGLLVGGGTTAVTELLRRYAPQWTAVGARKMSNLLSSQKYAPLFEAAVKRGGSAVPYLHEKLFKEDPEYRQSFNAINEEEKK